MMDYKIERGGRVTMTRFRDLISELSARMIRYEPDAFGGSRGSQKKAHAQTCILSAVNAVPSWVLAASTAAPLLRRRSSRRHRSCAVALRDGTALLRLRSSRRHRSFAQSLFATAPLFASAATTPGICMISWGGNVTGDGAGMEAGGGQEGRRETGDGAGREGSI
jgi:hypothetical protein